MVVKGLGRHVQWSVTRLIAAGFKARSGHVRLPRKKYLASAACMPPGCMFYLPGAVAPGLFQYYRGLAAIIYPQRTPSPNYILVDKKLLHPTSVIRY